MPTDKQDKDHRKEQIKVTDKRIFTPDGEIRAEFRDEIHPAAPQPPPVRSEEKPPAAPAAEKPAAQTPAAPPRAAEPPRDDRRRSLAEKGENPGTPFSNFIEQLIAQGYMSLGLLRNPYAADSKVDVAAARQMIDILSVLQEKTAGNLTPDEEDFLAMHLGELKLAFVQRTKSI